MRLPKARQIDEVDEKSLGGLTERQIVCLRMVAAHMTSKEIARVLNISPYTVDQRLDAARRKLNVASRKEAALIFAQSDSARRLSQELVYEPQTLARRPQMEAVVGATTSTGVSDKADPNATPGLRQSRKTTFASRLSARLVRLSFPPLGGERHDLSRPQIALMSLKIAFYSTVLLAATIAIIIGTMRLF
jgi:DNA-binding CsgD family transcriptional regulator